MKKKKKMNVRTRSDTGREKNHVFVRYCAASKLVLGLKRPVNVLLTTKKTDRKCAS